MFYSYVVYDVIEVEPVYLPQPPTAPSGPATGTGNGSGGSSSNSLSPRRIAAEEPTTATSSPRHRNAHTAAGKSLVKTLFGSVEQLRGFLQRQEERGSALGPPVDGGDDEDDDDTYRATLTDAVLHRLTEKYVGRVLPRYGLCVAIRDVLELSPAEIRGPSASAWVGVVCEVCVFAPRPEARLRATVLAHTPRGLFLSFIGFLVGTVSVFVRREELLEGSLFDREKGVWFLAIDEDEGEGEGREESKANGRGRNDYVVGEAVVFKVLETKTRDAHSLEEAAQRRELRRQQAQADGTSREGGVRVASRDDDDEDEDDVGALMLITGSFLGDGLGPVAWFAEDT